MPYKHLVARCGSPISASAILVCFVLLAVCGSFAQSTSAPDRATVKIDVLPVYSEMSTTSAVVKSLKKGDAVTLGFEIRQSDEAWCSIKEPGQTKRLGYVLCRDLDRPKPTTYEISQIAPASSPETFVRKTTAPDFTLRDLDGNVWSLHDHRGKFVLLDFWAIWCGPCRAELPHLEEIEREYRNRGLEVVTIDAADPPETAARYVHSNRFTFTTLLDPNLTASRLYEARYIPTLVLIDPEGNTVLYGVGYHPSSVLRSGLAQAGVR
jgi:thiol-disulfide isomerase/thioredoxin